jgi:outer membrane receptor protein involved in Fe transport
MPKLPFDIARAPLASSLTQFAVQAKISIGFSDLSRCGYPVKPLVGRYAVETGLRRLLGGTGCGFRRIDERAFSVEPMGRFAQRSPPPARTATEPSPPLDLSELVVVATRHLTPADRLAYGVSSTSGAVLRQQGVSDLSQLSLLVPSTGATNLGMGRDKVIVRGLSDSPLTGLTQSVVGLYLDDARLTFNAPDPDLRLTDIERVEILRGPQGALYGSGSIGGVVQIVAGQPDPTRRAAWVSAAGGFIDGGSPSHVVEGMLNVPLLDQRGAARLVLYQETDGGYVTDSVLKIKQANEAQRNGGRLALKFDLNDKWTLNLGAVIQYISADDSQYYLSGLPVYTRGTREREPHENDFRQYRISATGDLGFADLHSTLSFVNQDLITRYDATFRPPAGPAGPPYAFDNSDHTESLISEEILTSRSDARIQWIAGFTYGHIWHWYRFTDTNTRANTVLFGETRHDQRDDAALFGQASVPIWRSLSFTLGGRLFYLHDSVSSVETFTPSFTPTDFAGAVHETGFAPKALLSARPWSQVLVYGQVERGYRGPGINTASGPTEQFVRPGVPGAQRFFKGDDLWSYEVGAKYSTPNGDWRLSTAAFDIEWRNIQSDQLLNSGLAYTANLGRGRNLGVELEAFHSIRGLQITANALFEDPKLNAPYPIFAALKNADLADAPAQSVGASVHYAWRLPGRKRLEFDTHWSYVGPSQLLLELATNAIAPLPHMGNYVTGRAAVSLVDNRWRFTLAVENPADIQGNTFAYGNPFSIRLKNQITPLQPRTIWIGAEASF